MDYISEQGALRMPEYGRYMQNLVEYACQLPTREERTRCAQNIVRSMMVLSGQKDSDELRRKLWDHVALMSNFQLDVDYPFGVPQPETLVGKPERLSYRQERLPMRYYGRVVQDMIEICRVLSPGTQEFEQAALAIAVQMKKNYLQWNRDQVDDERIADDIARLSGGRIQLQPQQIADASAWLEKTVKYVHPIQTEPKPAKKRKR
jgi:hypothetical protein